LKISSINIIFIHWLFVVNGFFSTGNIFSRTFPDFVKFKDISRTWKMNMLFSRFSRMHGNPVITWVKPQIKTDSCTPQLMARYKLDA